LVWNDNLGRIFLSNLFIPTFDKEGN